jgi:hypothetical protein
MNKIFIVGIDPGKSGGIVALTNGKITDISKMPQSPIDLVNHFVYLGFPNQPVGVKSYVIMEAVHSMPTDGSKSAFSFGKQVGHLEGVLASLGISPRYVRPQEWQAFYSFKREEGESKYDYKKRMRDYARKDIGLQHSNKITSETADSYLIAKWFYKNINKILKES